MENNSVVETIRQQLVALGMKGKLTLVKWDNETLKVSKGENGSLIRYNEATDLYDVTGYRGCEMSETRTDVYAENLLGVIAPSLRRAA